MEVRKEREKERKGGEEIYVCLQLNCRNIITEINAYFMSIGNGSPIK